MCSSDVAHRDANATLPSLSRPFPLSVGHVVARRILQDSDVHSVGEDFNKTAVTHFVLRNQNWFFFAFFRQLGDEAAQERSWSQTCLQKVVCFVLQGTVFSLQTNVPF